jgi:hypothetical protein
MLEQQIADIYGPFVTIEFGAMIVLLVWGVTNIVAGGIFFVQNKQYFWQMMVMWNIINLLIALVSLFRLNQLPDMAEPEILQHTIFSMLIVAGNIGLNITYFVTAFALDEIGRNKTSQRLQGYAKAIFVQATFLLVFDVVLLVLLYNQFSSSLLGI